MLMMNSVFSETDNLASFTIYVKPTQKITHSLWTPAKIPMSNAA